MHSTLSKVVWPWFHQFGWQRRKGSSCAFLKRCESTNKYWCFWVQISQWGGKDFGNSFTLDLILLESHDIPPYGGADSRVLNTLTGRDRQVGIELETKIAGRIPEPAPECLIYEWMKLPGDEGAAFKRMWTEAFVPHPDRWNEGMDISLRYFALDDVEEWAQFLLRRLEMLTDRTRCKRRSESA